MVHIPDPFNDSQALAPDGKIDMAIWMIPAGQIKDPTRPTVAELQGGFKIGYGRLNIDGEDE